MPILILQMLEGRATASIDSPAPSCEVTRSNTDVRLVAAQIRKQALGLVDDLFVEEDNVRLVRVEGAYLETHGLVELVEVCPDLVYLVSILMTIITIQTKGPAVTGVASHLFTTEHNFLGLCTCT